MWKLIRPLQLSLPLAVLVMAGPALAQTDGSCGGRAPQVSPAVASGFRADPSAFLAGLAAGNQDVSDMVRRLAIQDPSAIGTAASSGVAALVQAAKSSPLQASAIARGLGAAARACIDANRPDLAAAIQATVLTQFDSAFQAEFARATSDTRTAATSAGGNGGANGGSGLTLTSLTSGRGGTTGGTDSSSFRNSDFSIPPTTGSDPTLTNRRTTGTTTTVLVTRTINSSASPASVGGF